jgi:outer membrane protein with beta-barrel domain
LRGLGGWGTDNLQKWVYATRLRLERDQTRHLGCGRLGPQEVEGSAKIIDAISGAGARLSPMGRTTVLLAVLIAATAQHAQAQEASTAKIHGSITVYGGDRFGGSVRDSATNSTIDLKNGSSFALALDIGLDQNTQLEVFYSQQNSALTSGAFSPKVNNIGLTLYNYQIGGTNFFEEVGRGLYVVGGLGGTTVKPDRSDLNSETFFSGNVGIGWMVPIGAHVGLRFEARGYGILLNNRSAVFCGGTTGCTIAIKGNALFQGEALAGIAARF